jgi:hypothetical protein
MQRIVFILALAVTISIAVVIGPPDVSARGDDKDKPEQGFFCCRYTCAGFDPGREQSFPVSLAICLSAEGRSDCPGDLSPMGIDTENCIVGGATSIPNCGFCR